MSNRTDLPTVEDDTREYWDAAREGVLLIACCGACQKVHHYPRVMCPHCWSEDLHAEPASGRATVYTYSVVHVNDLPPFKERLPYIAAMVELEEGPRVMTNIVDCDPADLAIGMPVVVDRRPLTDELTALVFRPA
jgi:uncharacterized OB-fold protein